MNIKPLVIQPQISTTDPPKSMQAEFYTKIIAGLQTLKKAFLYTVPNKNLFFFKSTQLSVLK